MILRLIVCIRVKVIVLRCNNTYTYLVRCIIIHHYYYYRCNLRMLRNFISQSTGNPHNFQHTHIHMHTQMNPHMRYHTILLYSTVIYVNFGMRPQRCRRLHTQYLIIILHMKIIFFHDYIQMMCRRIGHGYSNTISYIK